MTAGPHSSIVSVGERIYRWLLRVLPTEFRGDFGDAMLSDVQFVRQQGAAFWWRETAGLLRAVVREHVDALRQDVKYALRTMRRTPGFTAMAIGMLAVGTGVNVAMFSVVDAVMLRSPFVDQGRIAILKFREGTGATSAVPLARYRALVAAPGPLQSIAAFGGGEHLLTGSGDTRRAQMECVSAAMFDVLGTRPLIGTTFTDADDRAGAAPKAVLAYEFWRQLGGSPNVVGSSLTLNGRSVTVTGVMPRGYTGALSRLRVDGWMPLEAPVAGDGLRGCTLRSTVNAFVRVRAPMKLDDARASFADLDFLSIADQTFDDVKTPLQVLSGAVLFILLIACANVGSLQLERALARRREMALRTVLGANRWRIARQMLTESFVLSLVASAVGVVATALSLNAVVSLLPAGVPHLREISVNGRVLIAAFALAAASATLSGLVPLVQFLRAQTIPELSSGSRSTSRASSWTRRSLVVSEIALSIIVLIGAALMIQTFRTLRPDHPGFDASRKIVTLVRLTKTTPRAAAVFFDDLLERLNAVPGIRNAAAISDLPLSGSADDVNFMLGDATIRGYESHVTPTLMSAMKMPITEGRGFTNADSAGAEAVAIINEPLAKRLTPTGSALGLLLTVSNPYLEGSVPEHLRIVGVATGVRNSGTDTRIRPEIYRPYAQDPMTTMQVVVETDGTPDAMVANAVKEQIRVLRPDLPTEPVTRMADILARQVVFPRFQAWLLGVFATLAVGLAAAGLMTTLGWWVKQRTRELGVRMALGASPRRLSGLIVRQGLSLGVVGILIGCAAAMGLTRLMKAHLYGVTPSDPKTFAGAALGMLCIAACAIYIPVRRATRVNPVQALRAD